MTWTDGTATCLNFYLTEQVLDWTVTWLICYLTELIHVLDWTATWLNKYLIQMTLLINPRHTWLILVTYETSFTMRGATKVTPQHTKYCACQEKLSWFILVAYETLFTLRAVTHITLQHLQILHLPQKVTFMIDPRHIWNVVYNARTNRGYPPTPPNTSPATKNASLKSKISTKFPEKNWNVIFYIAKAIWAWSEHETVSLQLASQCHEKRPSNISKYCTCHEKWLS